MAVLGCAAAISSARAGDPEPFRLEEYVLADALAFVSIDGFPTGWRTALGATPLGAALRDDGFDSAIRPAFELLRRALGRGGADAVIATRYASALEGLDGQLAIAVTGIRRDGTLDVVVSLDFGSRLSEFEAFTNRVLKFPPNLESWVSEIREDGGAVVARFVSGETVWEAFTVGTTIVLDNLDRWSASSGPIPNLERVADSLARVRAFEEIRGVSPRASASCFAYANLAKLVAHSLDAVDGRWSGAYVHAAGLASLTTVSYRAEADASGVVETLRVGAVKAEKGIFSLFRTVPIPEAPLPDAPPLPEPRRVWCRLRTSLPIPTWPSRWRAFVHDVDLEDEQDVIDGLARLDHACGVDIEADVLSALGDEQTLSIGLSDGGGAFPDVVLSTPIRGAATVEPLFERVIAGLLADFSERGDLRLSQRTIRAGSRVMYVVDARDAIGGASPAFSPTWAIVNGRFVVTLVPHTMRALFRRIDRAGALGSARVGALPDSISRITPDLAALLSAARASGTSVELSTRDLLSSAYDTLVPLAQAVPAWKDALRAVDFDAARLPHSDLLTDAMSDTVMSLEVGRDGVSFAARSPLGVVPLALLIVGSIEASTSAGSDESDGASEFHPMAYASSAGDDPADVTRRALERTIQLLEEYQALHGSFPPTLDELVVSERLIPAVPLDGWRRRVGYHAPANGRPPRVTSAGADGVFGTDDDVGMDVELAPK